MERQRFSRKTGIKRRNNQESFRKNKRRGRDVKIEENQLSCDSDSPNEKLEEESVVIHEEEEEEMCYREPTMYENLLRSLSRQKVVVTTDSEEDSDDAHEPHDGNEESGEESDDGSSILGDLGDGHKESDLGDDADSEVSDTDEEQDVRVNGQLGAETLTNSSTFHKHLGYKFSNDEANKLLDKKWKYKWNSEESNCKWKGTGECFLKELDMNSCHGLKPVLYKHWLDTYKESGGQDFHSSRQMSFFSMCNSYRDILHHNKRPFYLKGREEDANIMDAYLVHSLNHVFMTRDLVKKNRAKLAKAQENMQVDVLNSEAFLDHGFTRPKVLILLPLASIALRVVRRLIELTPSKYKANIEERDRFFREFESEATTDEYENMKTPKPSDYKALFGGKNNDHFMLGIKFNRRSIRLYSDFYSSDMIIASPLGLVTKIGEAEAVKEKDVDYLSSIEVLIIDHADVMLMQNWFHVVEVLEKLNNIPSKQRGTDIMRIRQWYLDGQAPLYRQTMILSSHVNQDINALFNRHCLNYEGKVKSVCMYKGVLPEIVIQVRQVYQRFDAKTIVDAANDRFEYFTKKLFPKIKDSIEGGIMIFISSYFDYFRVKKFLKAQEASFCKLGEYTKQSDISRARNWFFAGQKSIMLYTERAHFYHRYKIRGVRNLIIYSLPERKEFYPEIVNMLQGTDCTALYSRFDLIQLERIVGSTAAKRMVTSDEGTFIFA
ncbi:unnamed protein product [Cuscuta epithymum]|uniref:U3 small nucleolar RNA-associated protein 25 n=1 Tax=Cuscuta epithymum TaxID=186058 RepID=A0AAV0E8Q3_9ASTE|nr:unnamed protein product [Cuscuta epithymum]